MTHHTKDKGDLAVMKTMLNLTEKGFDILTPTVSEHLPFDLVGYRDNTFYRFQVKYRSDGFISNKTSWSDKNGSHVKEYGKSDFDYYALYIPDVDKVCYPSIFFGGSKITTTVPDSANPFYWYEDFLELTDSASKRTYKDFGYTLTKRINPWNQGPRIEYRKVVRPSKEELEKLLWEKPMMQLSKDFGVSDKAISKWAKSYGIETPGRGYWAKQKVK